MSVNLDKTTDERLKALQSQAIQFLESTISDLNISPQIIDAATGLNYRRIYRWLGGFFVIKLDQIEVIFKFRDRIKEIQDFWGFHVKVWNEAKIPRWVERTLFDQKFLDVVYDEKLSHKQKILRLTKMTVYKIFG